jgi:hypothetical protein
MRTVHGRALLAAVVAGVAARPKHGRIGAPVVVGEKATIEAANGRHQSTRKPAVWQSDVSSPSAPKRKCVDLREARWLKWTGSRPEPPAETLEFTPTEAPGRPHQGQGDTLMHRTNTSTTAAVAATRAEQRQKKRERARESERRQTKRPFTPTKAPGRPQQ